jgi:hypothetical protein
MNKAKLALLTLASAALLAPLQANIILYEGFDYAAVALVNQNGGTGFSGAWKSSGLGGDTVTYPGLEYTSGANSLNVVGGYTTVTNTSTAGSYRDFSAVTAASDTVTTYWISVIASTAGGPYDASGDEASLQFRNANNVELVSVGAFGSSANWRIRAKSATGSTTGFSDAGDTPSSLTQAYLVIRVDVDTSASAADNIYLWVDPILGSEPTIASAMASITGTNFWNDGEFSVSRLRSGLINSGTADTKTLTFDELRLGTSFNDVSPIPEPAEIAAIMGVLVAALGFLRRRRS